MFGFIRTANRCVCSTGSEEVDGIKERGSTDKNVVWHKSDLTTFSFESMLISPFFFRKKLLLIKKFITV